MSPSPLTQFVVKIHSRCDLACDHCYVYQNVDQSWHRRPMVMSLDTIRSAASRIAEHAATHGLTDVRVVFHGGEPLLVGAARLDRFARELRSVVEPGARLDLRMQSNGVVLNPQLCDILRANQIRVGISLDGDRASNDRHRRYVRGASSHGAVLRALALLRTPEYRTIYGGILCTVDIRNDPIAVYEALLAEEPPRVDLLLPHATWESPPLGWSPPATPYADWLLRIFRRWSADGRPVPIRIFDSVLAIAGGGHSGTEALGLEPADIAVIETDGAWEQADSLKVTVAGGPETGLDVFRHTADEVAALPEIERRRSGIDDLCATCRSCPVVRQCGGGLFAHRYRASNGFDNPSVFCADLKELIMRINEDETFQVPGPRSVPAVRDNSSGDLEEIGSTTFDAIGTGYGGRAAVGRLVDLQFAITRTLLAAVAERAPSAGWQLLLDVERRAPLAVRSVLAHPYVRAWAVACLNTGAGRVDVLNSVAAACAIRGEVAAELVVPAVGGSTYLPTLGVADLSGGPAGSVVLSTAPGRFRLRDGRREVAVDLVGSGSTAGWLPTAWLMADGGQTFVIEDSDPYRDCHGWTPTGRLNAAARDAWRGSIAAAWRAVRADAPGQVPGMAAGLRVVTPHAAPPDGSRRSSSSRHAFGAVAVGPTTDEALAELLVHEFQHAKLAALLDVLDLVDSGHGARLTVGWRPDPRPVEAALHGAYAHLGVADVWRSRAERDGDAAAKTYRMYHDWTSNAIDAILTSGALTPVGQRFVRLMGETIGGWR